MMNPTQDDTKRTFFVTFGTGQVNFPGYVEVSAVNRDEVHEKMFSRYGPKWGFIYNSLDEVHPLDRILRGKIS